MDHYVLNPTSARNAAIAAGYSPKSAGEMSYKLMCTPLVAAAVAQKMQERMERTMITQDRVLHELAILAFSNITHYDIDPITGTVRTADGVPEYAMRAVSAVKHIVVVNEDGETVTHTTEFKMWNKVDALRLVMKSLGMLDDRIQIDGKVETTQTWKIGDREVKF